MTDALSDSSASRPSSPAPVLSGIDDSHQTSYRFTWDAVPRRSGTKSIFSETTESRPDIPSLTTTPRADIFGSSLTLLAPGVLPVDWSSSKHGFHAISTVLNNPRQFSAPPKAHSSLPAISPAELPRVRRKDFDPYLRAIGPEWERFESQNQTWEQVSMGSGGNSELPSPQFSSSRSLPGLDIVPTIFFETSFDLGNPKTFALVTGQPSTKDGPDPASIAHSLPLLERLSHYADTVELHLVREISIRSASFFAALSNLHELQSESEQCIARISGLRAMLEEVDERQAKKGLQVTQMEAKLSNMAVVQEGIRIVKDIDDMYSVAQGLVNAGEWGQALAVIRDLGSMWKFPASTPTHDQRNVESKTLPPLPRLPTVEESPPLFPEKRKLPVVLSSLQAFVSLSARLQSLTREIATSLASEMVSALKDDLVTRFEYTGQLVEKESNVDENIQTLKDRLRPLVQDLVRVEGVRGAIQEWREVVIGVIRLAVKRHLPSTTTEFEDDDSLPKKTLSARSESLANDLRSSSHAEFISLAKGMYSSLLHCLDGVKAHGQVVVEVVESLLVSSPESSVHITALRSDVADVLSVASELANSRVSKVVSVRADQHAALSLREFLEFFHETWTFVVACEVLCRRMIVGLRGVVVTQAKAFLSNFHAYRITQSAKLVEDEQWSQIEVRPSSQRVVDLLIDAAVEDPPETIISPRQTGTSSNNTSSSLQPNNTPPLPAKYIRIEERTYFAVAATLHVLILVVDYVKVIVNLSLLTTDCMGRVIEFLKAFNSRTCQVVLGAGAMRSAGLKNITARHLALASQSLSIMIALIPYVRETFRRHLNPKQAVMLIEFDKLKRDYQEHQNEIHSKLVSIMGDRLSIHCKSLQDVNWEIPREGPSEAIEALVKETVTLHKVLAKYLGGPSVELIMSQVFAAINHRLEEEYGKIELLSQEAKSRLLTDARFVHQKLSVLKGVGTISAMLETVVQEKFVPRKSPFNTRKFSVMLGRESNGTRQAGVVADVENADVSLGSGSEAATPEGFRTPEITKLPNGGA